MSVPGRQRMAKGEKGRETLSSKKKGKMCRREETLVVQGNPHVEPCRPRAKVEKKNGKNSHFIEEGKEGIAEGGELLGNA